MNHDYYERPDGEYFADQVEKPIPSKESWPTLSFNQLTEIKTTLQDKAFMFRNNPNMAKVLNETINYITHLIGVASSAR